MKSLKRAAISFCFVLMGALPAYASQNVDEVIRMSKDGTTAEVLIAYVEKSNADPRLTADDITALEGANVPAAVIEAMLGKEKAAGNVAVAGDAPSEPGTVAPAADNADISYFYSSLSNDGTWVNDPEYGWSWNPTISVGDPNWRPYVDNGSWVYTDDGWYWNSGYSWGWAAFHYGRWSHQGERWSWHPDNVWGSSWVSWRNNDNYYGWAPLSPRARFGRSGGFDVGITTGNFDLNIGIGERDYAFVRSNQFFDHDLNRHQANRTEVTNIYKTSTITNNYGTGNNQHVINHGIPVKSVALATKVDIKPVTIVDHPAKAGEVIRPGASVANNRLEVYRPKLAERASLDPVAAAARRSDSKANRVQPSVKQDEVADRQAARKAEAVKRVAERAAKEPQLKPRTPETQRRDPVDAKATVPPARVPEAATPRAPQTPAAPERREANPPPPSPKETVRPEQPERKEPPARTERPEPKAREERLEPKAREERPEPKAREERPAQPKPDRAERSDKPEKPDRNEK